MTRTYIRPFAIIASALLVSTMWFQTLAMPASAETPTATIATIA